MNFSRDQNQPPFQVQPHKLVLLGESAVGKSSISLRFVKDQFLENQETTIGAAFLTQSVNIEGTIVKFEIWDTAGQEPPMYYRNAHAAIVVYDLTAQETFTRARNWISELKSKASPNIVIALVGNKKDLESKRVVEYEDSKRYAESEGLLFFETSAKTATNVQEVFATIAKKLPLNNPESRPVGVSIESNSQNDTKKCC